ncbi:MAG: hypothetical protein AAGI38_06730 [Bacteroidota bacterium]
MKLTTIYLSAVLLFLAGCDSASEDANDVLPPQIFISSPEARSSFRVGEWIYVEVELAENDVLHQYTMIVDELDSSRRLLTKSDHLHSKEVTLLDSVKVEADQAATWQVMVIAEDHNGNVAQAVTEVNVFP